MGQVHVRVMLTNHREEVMARLGQLAPEQVHRYETEALIDTGAVRSTIPPAVADRLGLFRLGHTDANYADGRVEEVDMTEAISLAMLGRKAVTTAMVLEDLDLMVDCNRNRLVPYQGTWDQPAFRV
jgi:predicted aspartyl protease